MREGPFATECVAVGSCRLYTAKSEYQVMKFVVTITQDEDGMFIAECPSITGCVSQGRTAEEAQMNVQDAIRECLEVRAEKGLPLTVMTRQVEVHVCHQSRNAVGPEPSAGCTWHAP